MDSRKSYLTSISLKQTCLHSVNEMCMLCTHTTDRKEKREKRDTKDYTSKTLHDINCDL